MEKTIVKITKDFDYTKIDNFKTKILEGIISSKKIGLPLVDLYLISPFVYAQCKRRIEFSPEFLSELEKASESLLEKYGSVTLRTCFKFVGLENPRGLLSWRNLKSLESIVESINAAFQHGEEVARKNKIFRFELGLILMGRISAEKGGIVVVDIEKEKLCSIDVCWGDAKLVAMGEGECDTFWIDESLKIVEKKIREKRMGYFFRENERKKIKVFARKRKLSSLSDEEAVNLARYAFKAARFYQSNVEIEFMIDKKGILDMYELQVESRARISLRLGGNVEAGVLIKGLGTCLETVKGKVRVIKKDSDLEKLLPGEIAVIHLPKADVCLPLFTKVKAVVADCGGITSHFATISRDFNIPCVLGTERATEVLKDGMEVIVDAGKGEVWLNE